MNLLTLAIHVSAGTILLYLLIILRRNTVPKSRFETLQQQADDLSRQNVRLQKESTVDGLTRIGNRAHFEIIYKMEWDRAYRDSKPVSMLMIDIDHFKQVNDQHGHTVGDKSLVAVALAIRGSLHRESDRLMRFGGEEFAVLLGGTDIEGIKVVCERILVAVRSLEFDEDISLTVSIGGGSIIPDKRENRVHFINLVDHALYRAKHSGRDRYRIADSPKPSISDKVHSSRP